MLSVKIGRLALWALCIFILVACSSGGGGSNQPTSNNNNSPINDDNSPINGDNSPPPDTIVNLTVGLQAINFISVEGFVPDPLVLTVSSDNSEIPWTSSIQYNEGNDWLAILTNNDAMRITPGQLPVGEYTAVISVDTEFSDPIEVPINYKVISPTTLAMPSVIFDLTGASTEPDISQNTTVSNDTDDTIDWIASADVPWIQFTSTIGNTANDNVLTVSLVPEAMSFMNNGTYGGMVSLTSSINGVGEVSVPVTVNIDFPTIDYLSPYTAVADTSNQVVIRGAGFASVANPELVIGGTSAIAVEVIDDTYLRFTHPALPAGTHATFVDNVLHIDVSDKPMLFVDPPNYAQVALPTTGTKWRIIHDPERDAIYALTSTGLFRHRHSNGQWTTDSLTLDLINDGDIMPDGSELIVIVDTGIVHVDLDSFQITGTYPYPRLLVEGSPYYLMRGRVLNSGKAYVTEGFRGTGAYLWHYLYDTKTHTYQELIERYQTTPIFRSPVGDFVAWGSEILTGMFRMNTFSATTESHATFVTHAYLFKPQFSRDASTMLAEAIQQHFYVYKDEQLVGEIPFSLTDRYSAHGISDDGTKAYFYENSGYYVHTFDITDPSGVFTLVNSVRSTVSPGPASSIHWLEVVIGENNLIVAGDDNVIVYPTP